LCKVKEGRIKAQETRYKSQGKRDKAQGDNEISKIHYERMMSLAFEHFHPP